MFFSNEISAQKRLEEISLNKRHSILISGPPGCGKSFLAKYYASILNIEDFQVVNPTVSDIKECVDSCISSSNNKVICIENLDTGVAGASYTLLKFLEEPPESAYIVITASNLFYILDTIISRSFVLDVSYPSRSDLIGYAKMKYMHNWDRIRTRFMDVFDCALTFKDVDVILSLSVDNLNYIQSLRNSIDNKTAITTAAWNLLHFPDNSETPIELILNYILRQSRSSHVRQAIIDCQIDLQESRIAKNAVISKLLMELKYTI